MLDSCSIFRPFRALAGIRHRRLAALRFPEQQRAGASGAGLLGRVGGDRAGSFIWFRPKGRLESWCVDRTRALDHVPGKARAYLRWQELEAGVAELLAGHRTIAMEYSPRNANPYVSKVDAGTIELVRSCGVEVVSWGDLVQVFEAAWDDDQWWMHREAKAHTTLAYEMAWRLIADRTHNGETINEREVQTAILRHFETHGLTTYHPPIVAVGPHSGDPHYEPTAATDAPIGRGDFVLINLWAKRACPRSVYSDLTRVGYVGEIVPSQYENLFKIVARHMSTMPAFATPLPRTVRCTAGRSTTRPARSLTPQVAGLPRSSPHGA